MQKYVKSGLDSPAIRNLNNQFSFTCIIERRPNKNRKTRLSTSNFEYGSPQHFVLFWLQWRSRWNSGRKNTSSSFHTMYKDKYEKVGGILLVQLPRHPKVSTSAAIRRQGWYQDKIYYTVLYVYSCIVYTQNTRCTLHEMRSASARNARETIYINNIC